MVIDSSVFVAIAKKEPGYEKYLKKISSTENIIVSTATLLETLMVLSRQEKQAWETVRELIDAAIIRTVPFDDDALRYATDGFLRYGKGRNSKAKLNYGDCISYGTAKTHAYPLLFKGADFIHTDIESAL